MSRSIRSTRRLSASSSTMAASSLCSSTYKSRLPVLVLGSRPRFGLDALVTHLFLSEPLVDHALGLEPRVGVAPVVSGRDVVALVREASVADRALEGPVGL